MKTALKYTLALVLLALLGCVTTAPQPKEQKAIDSQGLDERLKKSAKAMNMSVHGIVENQIKGTSCNAGVTKIASQWNWVDAVNAANSCFKAHDFNSLESIANQLSIKETSTPWGPYYSAEVALNKGQLDRALWMAELSVKRAPEFGVTHYLKGQVLWARQDYKPAAIEFETALSYDNGIGPAHLILGLLYLRDQDYTRASTQFEAALKSSPDDLMALNGQAECQMHLNNPHGALSAYVRLTDLDISNGFYLSQIGQLYEGPLNNPERAINAYQKLHDLIKSGKVTKNIDPENDSKIKELQTALEKSRAVASTKEKPPRTQAKGGGQ